MSAESRGLHVAIIMDGNGRWAQERGLARLQGHHAGAEAVDRTVEAAVAAGLGTLTLYAFSSENWRRPRGEILGLMALLNQYLRKMRGKLIRNGVRLRWLGRRDRVPAATRRMMESVEAATAHLSRMTLCLAVDYGGRWELLEAAWKWARTCGQKRAPSEEEFARALPMSDLPDVNLVIRTSGEQRLSNFLPWHTAYAELYFSDIFWPEFDATQLKQALDWYAHRSRRFGGLAAAPCSA